MKIKEVTVTKKMKVGLPNFSNIDVGVSITAEVGEKESISWNELWNELNRQLAIQTDGIDPAWMQTKEYANFFKVIVKQPKLGGDK